VEGKIVEKVGWKDETPDTSNVTYPTKSERQIAAEHRAKLKQFIMKLLGLVAGCWIMAIGMWMVSGPHVPADKIGKPFLDRNDVPADWRYP
jgi:hypothetical protein